MADVYAAATWTQKVTWMREHHVTRASWSVDDTLTDVELAPLPPPDDTSEPTQQSLSKPAQQAAERQALRARAQAASGGLVRRLDGHE